MVLALVIFSACVGASAGFLAGFVFALTEPRE